MKMKKMLKQIKYIFFSFALLMIFFSCGGDYVPKPRGYMRTTLPEKSFQRFDSSTYPYAFEYPSYAKIDYNIPNSEGSYWLNIFYPSLNATIYLSYKPVNNDLSVFTEDTRTFVIKHIPKATGIDENAINDTENQVYGMSYDISGKDAASPYQFYLTDSVKHFVRGALYFKNVPNNDSLAPVIDFIKDDISHLFETFEWQK